LPLFPGYVFLLATPESRIKVLETNLVVRYLHVEDQEQLESDLARVHRLMEAGQPLTPLPRLLPGAWVEVTEGSLAGTRGKVLREGGRCRFIVEVHFLQRGVSLEVDARMLRPVSAESARPAVSCLPV
jgi:hypothetical protein